MQINPINEEKSVFSKIEIRYSSIIPADPLNHKLLFKKEYIFLPLLIVNTISAVYSIVMLVLISADLAQKFLNNWVN